MNILWYLGIGGAGLIALKLYSNRTAAISADRAPASGGMTSTPLFMGMGGGTQASPVSVSPLGGEGWSSGSSDTAPSDDVLIAQIQKEVALAQIAAQKEIAEKGFAGLYPQVGSGGTAGQPGQPLPETIPALKGYVNPVGGKDGKGAFVPTDPNAWASIIGLGLVNSPYGNFGVGKTPKVHDIEAIGYIKTAAKKGDTGYLDIYNQAKERGYNATETAALLQKSGIQATAADVNKFTDQAGLNRLKQS